MKLTFLRTCERRMRKTYEYYRQSGPVKIGPAGPIPPAPASLIPRSTTHTASRESYSGSETGLQYE